MSNKRIRNCSLHILKKIHNYREKFGIHNVNFSDPALPRTAKESSKFLAQLISDNGFVEENMP